MGHWWHERPAALLVLGRVGQLGENENPKPGLGQPGVAQGGGGGGAQSLRARMHRRGHGNYYVVQQLHSVSIIGRSVLPSFVPCSAGGGSAQPCKTAGHASACYARPD
jgi:hypothetical protein